MTYYPSIGMVSEGTMRTEDLLDTLSSELSYHMKRMRLTRRQRKNYNELLRQCREFDNDDSHYSPDDADEYVSELFDALNEIAPPYAYFGASEGDGACYGFWPIVNNDELPMLTAGDEIPREHWGEVVYIVNDHGNVDCGHVNRRGKFNPYWSVV